MNDRRPDPRISRRSLVAGGAALAGAVALPRPGRASTRSRLAQGEPVALTLLDHQAPRLALLEEMLPAFEEQTAAQGRPITVELQEGPAPDEEFQTKLTLDYDAGNAADVTSFGGTLTPDFAASGYLLDLTALAAAWPDWQAAFYPKMRDEQLQPDGKLYTIPREASIMQLFYRKDVLEANQISTDQPRSWRDLLDRMVEAKEKIGQPPLLFPAGEAWGGGTFSEGFIHLMLGTDSPLYDREQRKWVVRSPGLGQVLKFYEDMVAAELLPVDPLLNPEPWVATKYEAFPAGELVATTCGTWCWTFDWGPEGAGPIDDIFTKVATWEFPTADGSETFVWGASGWVWAIAAESEHPEEAWELVKWLGGGDFMARNAATIGAASPRNDLQAVAPYSDFPFLIDAERRLEGARSFPSPTGTDRIIRAVGEATEEIITGRATAAEATDAFAARATELLGEENVTEIAG